MVDPARMQTVVCAIDGSDLAPRVLRHAVGMAAALRARLIVLHVGDVTHETFEARVLEIVPYGTPYVPDLSVRVEEGPVADVISGVADEAGAALIVAGTRARSAVARFFLGSVSSVVLERTARPVLLVSPSDVDVVTLLPDRAVLHFGPVLAAVDLDEANALQLEWAARLASRAGQPFELMTVVRRDELSNHDAAEMLKARGRGMTPAAPRSYIVRRGDVGEEIARCAQAEGSGLIVMGLRSEQRGHPGTLASAVIEHHPALLLAVPDRAR